MISAADAHESVVRSMLIHLFPVGMQYINGDTPEQRDLWQDRLLGSRRVAHEDVLRLYMERVVGGDLPAHYDAERVFAYMSDCNSLDQFLRSLEPEQWPDVIFHLSSFEFRREHVEPGKFLKTRFIFLYKILYNPLHGRDSQANLVGRTEQGRTDGLSEECYSGRWLSVTSFAGRE